MALTSRLMMGIRVDALGRGLGGNLSPSCNCGCREKMHCASFLGSVRCVPKVGPLFDEDKTLT